MQNESSDNPQPLIDLSANLTDSSFFPYSTLRQIYRQAFSPQNDSLMQQTGDFCGD